MMNKEITSAQLQKVYDLGCLFALQKISLAEALEQLVGSLDMNQTSATHYMRNFVALSEGKVYKRAMSALSYEIFLSRFYQDFPSSEFELVMKSVELHLEYRLTESNVKHHNVRALVDPYRAKLVQQAVSHVYPDEVSGPSLEFTEGAVKQVNINAYERNPKARAACIEKYGATCQVCDLNFENKYGKTGKGFIHVHHKVELATIGENYQVDPVNDLIPVCPNCHAMLHTEKPAMDIGKLKQILATTNVI